MKNVSLPAVLSLLKEERVKFETGEAYDEVLAHEYSHYAPQVGNVYRFLEQAKLLFPNWNCGLTSVAIRNRLGFGDIMYGSYNKESHTFLTFTYHCKIYIADITADQFGGPKIYCGPLKKPWSIEPGSKY